MAHEEAQPTRLLYYEDAYTTEFTAKVLRVQEQNGLSKILLDQTAFYPAGGGHPSDTGKITGTNGDVKISEARFEEGLLRIFLEFVPDFLFSLQISSTPLKGPDTTWQIEFFPIHERPFEGN